MPHISLTSLTVCLLVILSCLCFPLSCSFLYILCSNSYLVTLNSTSLSLVLSYLSPYLLVFKYFSCVSRSLGLNTTLTSLTCLTSLAFDFVSRRVHEVCLPWTLVYLDSPCSDLTLTAVCLGLTISDPPQTSFHPTSLSGL